MSPLPPQIQALREGFKFLGNKLDQLITVSKGGVQIDIGKEFTKSAMEAVSKALSSSNIKIDAPNISLEPIAKSFSSLKQAIEKKSNKDIIDAIGGLKKSMDSLELFVPAPDFKEVVKELKNVGKKIDNIRIVKPIDNSKELQALGKKLDVLAGKKMMFPKEFKLDKMQLSQISAGSGRFSVGSPSQATKTTVANVTMADADTQYSYTFPTGTVQWRIKLRAIGNTWFYSWTTGKLPVSGDASEYVSIPSQWLDSRDGINYGGKTIFFESGTASQIMEIDSGQL